MTEMTLDDEAWEALPLQTGPNLATPWARFWARALDITLVVVIASIPFWFLLAFTSPALYDALLNGGKAPDIILQVILLPFALLLDAVIIRIFGTTLGKAIVGARLRSIDGERLGLRTLLRRTLGLYVKGYGLGLPLISLITFIRSFWAVRDGGIASWDRDNATRVFAYKPNIFRTTACAILFIVVASLLTLLAM